jgi:hypothetical protein
MSLDETLENSARTTVDILTTPASERARKRILRSDSEVVIVGDHDSYEGGKGLSPAYTEHLASAIQRWQIDNGNRSGNVTTHTLPKERPMLPGSIPQELSDNIRRADIVIGTYGSPGAETENAERDEFFRGYVVPMRDRLLLKKSPIYTDSGLYVVAARPVESVLEAMADTKMVRKARRLGLAVKKYLDEHRGETMRVYSEGDIPLILQIPKVYDIEADAFAVSDAYAINIPSGEVCFAPALRPTTGEVVMGPGSYHDLTTEVEGKIRFKFRRGKIVEWANEGGKDEAVERYIREDFAKSDANRYIAEMAIGVVEEVFDIPIEDRLYNKTILEKGLGWHFAWGNAQHVGGRHDAPSHVDNCFRYGRIEVGDDVLLIDGKPNEELLKDYMPEDT